MKWFLGIAVVLLLVFASRPVFLLISASYSLSGATPPWKTKSHRDGFVRTINIKLNASQRVGRNIQKFSARPIDLAEHAFLGRKATDLGDACLVDMDQAFQQTSLKLKEGSGYKHVERTIFRTCEDFVRVHPPLVPGQFTEWGPIAEEVRHTCYSVRSADAFKPQERTELPTGHLSIATVFQGPSTQDIITQLKQFTADDDTVLKLSLIHI